MRSNYFSKMALRNIRANKQLYLPYAISTVLTVGMFLQMVSLMENSIVLDGRGGGAMGQLFSFGSVVIGLFSLVFLLYANSFLIKRRKKEIGLYGILGLEKRHVARILLVEAIMVGAASILVGLVTGTIFGRLFFMLLNYLLRLPFQMDYELHASSFLITAVLFAGVYFVAFLYNVSQVTFSNPISLLKGEKEGEKEPKSNIFLFLLGVISTGAGYWISVTISDPLQAMIWFFGAVLLVIVGTYLLFTSGSIFILKMMKRNKKIYYQPRGFISISGMLYRMKQNATGLANISILACMVIVAMGTTMALYIGSEQTVASRYPAENHATVYYRDEVSVPALEADLGVVEDTIKTEPTSLEIQDFVSFIYGNIFGDLTEDSFEMADGFAGSMPQTLIMISLDDFNRIENLDLILAPNEIYIHSSADYTNDTLTLAEHTFQVNQFSENTKTFMIEESMGQSVLLVMPSRQALDDVLQSYQTISEYSYLSITANIQWETTGTAEEKAAYTQNLRPKLHDLEEIVNYETQTEVREEWYVMNGSFLFLGIFLGIIFIIGTVLITYFKQISEGYDDRERIQIMQKVGLSKEMIRETSRTQVVWMFMLPLLVATVHTAFAYPILHKLLLAFGMVSHLTLILSIAGVVVSFSLIYWIIYRMTAKVYYSIVQ